MATLAETERRVRDPKAFAVLAEQLNASDDALRRWAARGLENLNTPAARQALLDAGLGADRVSYRRADPEHVGGDSWRRRHRLQLIRWLPAEVVDSQRALNYVLLHGEDHLGTRWTPEWLSRMEAAAFLAFLETNFSVQDGYEIFGHLRRRANA